MKRIALLCLTAAFVVGCQDTPAPTDPGLGEPSLEIRDGTDDENGNPDFWWLPPNVPRIKAKDEPNYDADEFDPNFEPIVRICKGTLTKGTGGTECDDEETAFPFSSIPGAGVVSVKPGTESYFVDWETIGVPVNAAGTIDNRILVVLEDFFDSGDPLLLGFADVDIVPEGRDKKDVADDAFVVVSGRTLPIKFRLEANLRCFEKDPCEATVVNLTDGGDLVLDLGGVRFNGGDEGTVSATAVPCTAGAIPVDIPVFGDCFTIDVTGLIGELTNPATVFQCSEVSVSQLAIDFGLSEEQLHLLRWHRFDEDPGEVVALPLTDDPCLDILASNLDSNPLMRFARAVRDGFNALVGPRPLYAKNRVRFWNTRSGGSGTRFSDFQLALPSKMVKVPATDGQTADAGTAVFLPPSVLVTDAHGNPVKDAKITFVPTDGAVLPAVQPVPSLANGKATLTSWTLRQTPVGTNNLTASCFGCATAGEATDGPQNLFDPFTPFPASASDEDPPGPIAEEADVVIVGGVPEPSPAVLLLLGQLVFTAEGVPGPPAEILFTVQPTTTDATAIMSPAVEVTLEDQFDNVTTNAAGNITLAIGPGSPAGGTLSGFTASVAGTGVGTFDDLRIDKVEVGYTLVASFAALSTTSAAFDVGMRVAGIGRNGGNTEADDIFSNSDLPGSITRLTVSQFNAKTNTQLADEFDVLLITWNSSTSLDVAWTTRLVPFLNAGGGVIYDGDPNNVADLAPGVPNAAQLERGGSNITVTASIPGLTTSPGFVIGNSFVNNHVELTTTTFPTIPAGFTQFLKLTESHVGPVTHEHNVGIYGAVGAGCIVLTGPDQDFHGVRGGSGAGLNQYNLLINELTFVTRIGGDNCVPPGS